MEMRERIKEKRKASALSQQQLSELLGLSFMTVRRWESGEISPRVNELKKLAEVLGTSMAYLMGLEDDPTPGQAAPQSAAPTPVEQTTRMTATGRLIYEWGDNNRLDLPDTPENREMLARVLLETMSGRKPE